MANNIHKHIKNTLRHKRFFIDSCLVMIDYLFDCGRENEALELAQRCSMHDHSKLDWEEVELFVQLPEEKPQHNVANELTEDQQKLIELHWKHNRHHPEFFTSYTKMSEIDIMEMVCDWHSRSKEFNNSFPLYLKTIPKKRFGFDDVFYHKVLTYCKVLDRKVEI